MPENPNTPPGEPLDNSLRAIIDERRGLSNIAYRMLGSTAQAEDVVTDTYLRWYTMSEQQQSEIENPTTWLIQVASQICLNILDSTPARHRNYVGNWIPEPIPDPGHDDDSNESDVDPADRVTLDETVSMSFLVELESLTPAQRVAFILHDVFKYPYGEISQIVGRSVDACRHLASTARNRIHESSLEPPPHIPHVAIVRAFKDACQDGDPQALTSLLDSSATVVTDGGGQVRAALRPISGAEKVARFFLGIIGKQPEVEIVEQNVNGRPGLIARLGDTTVAVIAIDVANGVITRLWMIMNPDKLHSWNSGAHS